MVHFRLPPRPISNASLVKPDGRANGYYPGPLTEPTSNPPTSAMAL